MDERAFLGGKMLVLGLLDQGRTTTGCAVYERVDKSGFVQVSETSLAREISCVVPDWELWCGCC